MKLKPNLRLLNFIVPILLFLFYGNCKAQKSCAEWRWAVRAGEYNWISSKSIAIDKFGNKYVTGNFAGFASFGFKSLINVFCEQDMFVAKFDSSGQWQWAVKAVGADYFNSNSIAVDQTGNVYITGAFTGTAAFGNTSLSAGDSLNIFIAKLNSSGQWQWAVNAGGTGSNNSNDLAIDATGNAYITGNFSGTTTFGNKSLDAKGLMDIFIAKLNNNGQWQWVVNAGGTGGNYGNEIAIDATGNAYITGNFSGTTNFGNKSLDAIGLMDIFITKLNSNGQWQWVVNAGGIGNDVGKSITVDATGNAYLTGAFSGIAFFGNKSLSAIGFMDIFIAKLTSNGQWQWAVKAGGTGSDDVKNIAIDTTKNVYITGAFSSTATFGSASLSAEGYTDIFIAKLSNSGQWQWVQKAGGKSAESSESIIIDEAGNAYITGYLRGIATFGNTSLKPASSQDIYIAMINDEKLTINAGIDQNIICGSGTKLNASGSGYSKISWYPQIGLSDPNKLTPQAFPIYTTTYSLKAENACGDSAVSQVTIIVNPLQITATTNKKVINCGESVQLNVTSNNSGLLNYVWTPSNGLSNPNISNPTARPNSSTTYIVTATTANGCTATDKVTITINNPNPPQVGLTTSTGENFFCNKGQIISAAPGFASYMWNTGDTTQSITATKPDTYIVEVIDKGGCGNKDSIILVPLTKINAPDGPYLCTGQQNASLKLDAGSGFDSYLWSNGQQTQSLTVATPGTYTVTVTKGSCEYTDQILVMNHPGTTTASFTYLSNGLQTQFTTLTQGVRFLDWNFGDGGSSSDFNPSHTYLKAGIYNVCLNITDLCGATDKKCQNITVNGTNRVEEYSIVNEIIKIYPNPANDILTIETSKSISYPIILRDIFGRQVLKNANKTDSKYTLNLAALEQGIYFISIGNLVYKFIKQ